MNDTPEPFVFLPEHEFNKLSLQDKVAYLRQAVEAVLFPREHTLDTSSSGDKTNRY